MKRNIPLQKRCRKPTKSEKNLCIQRLVQGKENNNTFKTTTTPSFTPTFDENDDMTAVYQEAVPTAELTVKGSAT